MTRSIAIALFALMFVGCGGTFVDDKHNFERALKFQRPKEVHVFHSIYWQSPHFTDEHCYFLELQPAEGSSILKTLTAAQDVAPVTDEAQEIPPSLALERPKWSHPVHVLLTSFGLRPISSARLESCATRRTSGFSFMDRYCRTTWSNIQSRSAAKPATMAMVEQAREYWEPSTVFASL